MLISFTFLYLFVSIALGLYAATKVKNMGDYVTAGRSLPIWVVMAMVFATWFGAETVLGIPAEFLDGDLGALISDPFGAALCLILFGLFFARKLYQMNLLTLGDFYRIRYDRRVELIASVAIAISYLGWVSAQIMALGLVFNVLSDGYISQFNGILLGTAVVLIYTLFGGMWSVAVTTFVQMIIIVFGLLFIAWYLSGMTGGVLPVIEHAAQAQKFNFLPDFNALAMLAFMSALLTMGLGSLAQQDVFQRANTSKNANVAVWGSVGGGVFYLFFAAVPVFLGYSAYLINPDLVNTFMQVDSQQVLPQLVKQHLPLFAQVIFYGALLSVIMSTASATMLAPSVIISENILRGFVSGISDRNLLLMTRGVVVAFALLVAIYTLWSLEQETSIHKMVENAYKVTLVVAFVPLVAGLYWKRASAYGTYLSIALGLLVWLSLEFTMPQLEESLPAHFIGFFAAIAGMVIGSWRWPNQAYRLAHVAP
ncbi:MAG: sodium:solute symporter family protein [Thiomicrospira sp.]|jgi:Na+/proline symporter|nr:sodium:solute symporter family protein [Thiomicrospira sp.]